MHRSGSPRPCSSPQTWSTFVRNHARETLACDFFVTVTATFRLQYVFLVLEIDPSDSALECHGASDGRVDDAAVSTRVDRRRSVPVRRARSGCRVRGRRGRRVEVDASAGAENTCPRPASECVLRATDRNSASRMSRPSHSAPRAASAEDRGRVGPSLQSRPPPREPRSWDSGAVRAECAAGGRPPTAARPSGRGESYSRRSPSRVSPRADRGVIPCGVLLARNNCGVQLSVNYLRARAPRNRAAFCAAPRQRFRSALMRNRDVNDPGRVRAIRSRTRSGVVHVSVRASELSAE